MSTVAAAAAEPASEPGSADLLLQTIAGLVAETRSARQTPTLDSDLERDLGLDSLSRSELLTRLEHTFQVRLPEVTLSAATPRELLQALRNAGSDSRSPPAAIDQLYLQPVTDTGVALPEQAATLVDMLDWHARLHPQRIAFYLYQDQEQPQPVSYAGLQQHAREVAVGLRARGIQPGQTVAIMLPTELGYFSSFFGTLLAGATPVPIYPPARPNQIEDHLRRHARILDNARCRLLITVGEAKLVARLLQAQVESLDDIVTVEELVQPVDGWIAQTVRAEDIAFVQYTSGSTGDPKGVILTHANLLANVRALVQRAEAGAADVFVSWLPLYHDMGLIGACLGSFYCGLPLVVMSPLRFLRRPASWLWAIHQHRGTLSAAPNFAYELCLRNIRDSDIEGLDLSSWRLACNGAEPVNPATMRRFAERFAGYGFRADALAPVYGLAECSVGLALPVPGRGLKVDRIDQERFSKTGEALPVAPNIAADRILEMVACGHVLAGHEMRVVDSDGRELPQRHEGRLQFRGPSATRGYMNNPAATAQLFDGDWLETGDRAYIADGDLFISGRVKDMIIRGGRNIYPYELEQAVSEIDGIRKGCVAVFASPAPAADAAAGSEHLVIVAETREQDRQVLEQLREQVSHCSVDILGAPADVIVLAPPHSVLKTSSGKIRRNAVRELYQRNALGYGNRALWWQLLRVAGGSIVPSVRNGLRRLGRYLFAGYAWLVFGLLALVVWSGMLVLPKPDWRWRFNRGVGRLALWLTGTRLSVEGPQNLNPPRMRQSCIVVANHASYLDALVLTTALPRDFRFVAKRELAGNRFMKFLLRRLGTILVERFDLQQASADNETAVQALRDGDSLVFFPEGTLIRTPGLLPFRLGAFVAAAQTQTPVVPVVIRGTRAMLLGGTWFPRRGSLQVIVCEPVEPTGDDWRAAVDLRDRARTVMLEHCGEPDLNIQDNPFFKSS
jgi:1-acyl-sn-glycerol-3-phosphate acyltransferase